MPSDSAVSMDEGQPCSPEARTRLREKRNKDESPVFTQRERYFEESKHVEIGRPTLSS